jgi:hypothetical protein
MSNDDDIPAGYGSLGGSGAEHHDTVKTKIGAEGVENRLRCDRCGRPLLVTIPWVELIFLSQGVPPPNGAWKHEGHNGVFMPNQQAPCCRDDIRLGITPDECTRHIKSAIAAGKITAQAVQSYLQQIQGQRR